VDAIGDLFGAILDRAGPERARALKLKARWRQVAGPKLAERARAEVVGSGVVLHARDARWVAELRRLLPELRTRLTAAIGPITSVDVRADPAGPGTPAADPGEGPPPAALDPGLAVAAGRIEDPDLRDRLTTVAKAYLAAAARRGPQEPTS
jgi:hypothetical protein